MALGTDQPMTASIATTMFAHGPVGYWGVPEDGSGMAYGNDLLLNPDGTGSSAHWCLGDSWDDDIEWESIGEFRIRLRRVLQPAQDWCTLHFEFRDAPLDYHSHSATLCEVGKPEGVWTIPESLHFHRSV